MAERELSFPPDALCDLLFFTHVLCDPSTDTFASQDCGTFQQFKAMAPRLQKTEMGLSIDERYTSMCIRSLKNKGGRDDFSSLMTNKIKHHGLVSVTELPNSEVLSVLTLLRNLQLQVNPAQELGNTNFLVIGIRADATSADFKAWLEPVKNATSCDIVLLHTHISLRNATALLPPSGASIWDSRTNKQFSMDNVIKQISTNVFAEDVVYMMTMTMTVQLYYGDPQTTNVVSTAAADFAETCNNQLSNPKEVHPEHYIFVAKNFSSGKTAIRLFYDTTATMKKKFDLVRTATEAKSPAIKHLRGWAFFDVDRDDPGSICGPAFNRLSASVQYLHP
ncbi:uncharacterized protein LOC135368474 [Ornithodoros turicata]|uniref:uncharacterized protein LOC135368474 n=1 Tax=Ornithodoros turicata TaxID=34597 RepID=UPI00313999C6